MGWIATLLFLYGCLLIYKSLQTKRYRDEYRAIAKQSFLDYSANLSTSRMLPERARVQIMDEKETVETSSGTILAYRLTVVARNPSGEYFFFLFRSDSSPLFKPIDQGSAKAILKKKYVAPAQQSKPL